MKSCLEAGHCRNGCLSVLCPIDEHAFRASNDPVTPQSLDGYRGLGARVRRRLPLPTTARNQAKINAHREKYRYSDSIPTEPKNPRKQKPNHPHAWLLLLACFLSLAASSVVTTASAGEYRSEHFLVNVTNGTVEQAKQIAERAEQCRLSIHRDLFKAVTESSNHQYQPLPAWDHPWPVTITLANSTGGGGTTYDKRPNSYPACSPVSAAWEGSMPALINDVIPHEVCHTVVASVYPKIIPRWLDEGLAQCFESKATQNLFLSRTIERMSVEPSQAVPFNTLLYTRDYPKDGNQLIAFYDQSAVVVDYILQNHSRTDLCKLLAGHSLKQSIGHTSSSLQIAWTHSLKESLYTANRPRIFPFLGGQPSYCSDGNCQIPSYSQPQYAPPSNLIPVQPVPPINDTGLPYDPADEARAPKYDLNPAPIVDPASPEPNPPPVVTTSKPSETKPCECSSADKCDCSGSSSASSHSSASSSASASAELTVQIANINQQLQILQTLQALNGCDCKRIEIVSAPTSPPNTPAPPAPGPTPGGSIPPAGPPGLGHDFPPENQGAGGEKPPTGMGKPDSAEIAKLKRSISDLQKQINDVQSAKFPVTLKRGGKAIKTIPTTPASGKGFLEIDVDSLVGPAPK